MKKFFLTALLISVLCGVSYGTDIPITPTGPVFKLLPAPTWGISGPTGFNNNFFFTPLSQNESVCVFVKNNNTTNPHTFTASILVNSDPANTTPSDGTWQTGASSNAIFAATSPGQPAGISVSVSGAAQVSVNFSASGTVAGSPETANVVIVQTTGNCFAGNGFIGSSPQSVSSIVPIQVISEGLSQAFLSQFSLVSPTSAFGQVIDANGGKNSLYFNVVNITCSATCSFTIGTVTTAGTTGCVNSGTLNEKINSSVTSTGVSNISCTGVPTAGNSIYIPQNVPAGNYTFDLRGFIAPAGSTTGIQISAITIVGNITWSFSWYEK